MHTSHLTMATLVNRAAPWWVNHWQGLFCKDELWLFNCCYHRNIQYTVISELCGTFICKILFPNNMKNLTKALSQIFFAIVSARSINHSFHERDLWGLFEGDIFACLIEIIVITKKASNSLLRHTHERRTPIGCSPAGLVIHHLSQTLLIRVVVSKTAWQL